MREVHEIEIEILFKDGLDYFSFEAEDDYEWLESFTDGPFSCDCKRGVMFDRELPCGQTTALVSFKIDGVEAL